MKTYIDFRNNLFNETLPFLDRTTNFLDAKNYLTWNCAVQPQRKNILLAKEYGIKSFVYNHGLYGHEDHCEFMKDIWTPIHKMSMDADKYLCWGERDYNDLLEAGVDKSRLSIVGFSGMWESLFSYKLETGKTLVTSYCAGETIEDPSTKIKGVLTARDHRITPRHKSPKWILYIPSHDTIERHLIHTIKNYSILKDIKDLIIKASSSYIGLDEKNPFKDVNNYIFCGKCDILKESVDDKWGKCECGADMPVMPKVAYTSINSPDNMAKLRSLIAESKVVITDYVGTPNLLCYAIGTPVITIKNDYGLRKLEGKDYNTTYHECPADILCEPDKLIQTIEDVIAGKIDKTKEMQEYAEILGGVSKGWPPENILKELECQ